MALITNDNVKKYTAKDFGPIANMKLVTFGDWKDELLFVESYPEYVHDIDVKLPNGSSVHKRWIIVPKDNVVPIVNELKEDLTEDSKIDIVDFDDRFETINDFLEFVSDHKVYEMNKMNCTQPQTLMQIFIDHKKEEGFEIIDWSEMLNNH